MYVALIITAVAVAFIAVCLVALRTMLRISSHRMLGYNDYYRLNSVVVKSDLQLFPSSYDFGYPEDHEGYKGFCVMWLWFCFNFYMVRRTKQ